MGVTVRTSVIVKEELVGKVPHSSTGVTHGPWACTRGRAAPEEARQGDEFNAPSGRTGDHHAPAAGLMPAIVRAARAQITTWKGAHGGRHGVVTGVGVREAAGSRGPVDTRLLLSRCPSQGPAPKETGGVFFTIGSTPAFAASSRVAVGGAVASEPAAFFAPAPSCFLAAVTQSL